MLLKWIFLCNFVYFLLFNVFFDYDHLYLFWCIFAIFILNILFILSIYGHGNKLLSSIKTSKKTLKTLKTSKTIIIIFDWDDTLYPTSNYPKKQSKKHIQSIQNQSKKLIQSIQNLINTAQSVSSNIYIISNADYYWIYKCLQTINLLKFMLSKYIPIKSAKESYSDIFPNKPIQWKTRMFHDILLKYIMNQSNNLPLIFISIGDSLCEYIACESAVFEFNKYLPKDQWITYYRIKLMDSPTKHQLINQLDWLQNLLNGSI